MIRMRFLLSSFVFFLMAWALFPQTPDAAAQPQEPSQAQSSEAAAPARHAGSGMQGHGTIGRITSMNADTLVVAKPGGSTVTIKLTGNTEFRKDREPAKLADFKVGDFVMVRGGENPDHTITADRLSGRSSNGGPGGARGGQFFGEMGKDFVAGEVKSIDAPKLTVLRPDNVTQTVELNEETSLRKGHESITLADIQPGDHVVLHGGLQNQLFVPKAVIVVSPEQWERMQQFVQEMHGPSAAPPASSPSGNLPHQ